MQISKTHKAHNPQPHKPALIQILSLFFKKGVYTGTAYHEICNPWRNLESQESFTLCRSAPLGRVQRGGVVIKLCWTCRLPLQPPWIIFSRRSASTRPWESWQNLCQSTSPHLCRSGHLLGFVLAFIETCSCSEWVGIYNAIFQESVKLRIVSSEKVKFTKIPSRKCREKTFANMNVMKQWRGRGNLYDGAGEWVIVCYCSALNASEERGREACSSRGPTHSLSSWPGGQLGGLAPSRWRWSWWWWWSRWWW